MFKKLQKLSFTIIALNLIFIFSLETLSMASEFWSRPFGGTCEREIPIDDELPLPLWQLEGAPNAYDPGTGMPLNLAYFGMLSYFPVTMKQEYYMGSDIVEDECPEGKVDYFKWWSEELQRLSAGCFDAFCDPGTEKAVLKFIKEYKLRTPIYFEDDARLSEFKSMYDALRQKLDFLEDPELKDENCFFAENLYFMACKFYQCKPNHSISDWKRIKIFYSEFFKEMFSLIPEECLSRVMSLCPEGKK